MEITIKDLTKEYKPGQKPALDHLSLHIGHGTFGLLGPNGAGKTTLIKILSTQMLPTSGQVKMDEWDLLQDRSEIRKRLGYLPQHFGTYPHLTAWEFLDYMAILGEQHNKKRRSDCVAQALHDVGLFDARNRRSGTFSGGMMRRLGIAQAILTDPEFLIVDEPTVGLDPEERIRFRGILGRLSRDRAILISTHIVADISSTCEYLAILRQGQLVFQGSPESLVQVAKGKTWTATVDDGEFEDVSARFRVVTVNIEGDRMNLRLVGEATPPAGSLLVEPNLEDAYVHFMGDMEI